MHEGVAPMTDDQIENLVEEAHKLFNKTSIHEVIDLSREEALNFLVGNYGPIDMDRFNNYMILLAQIKWRK